MEILCELKSSRNMSHVVSVFGLSVSRSRLAYTQFMNAVNRIYICRICVYLVRSAPHTPCLSKLCLFPFAYFLLTNPPPSYSLHMHIYKSICVCFSYHDSCRVYRRTAYIEWRKRKKKHTKQSEIKKRKNAVWQKGNVEYPIVHLMSNGFASIPTSVLCLCLRHPVSHHVFASFDNRHESISGCSSICDKRTASLKWEILPKLDLSHIWGIVGLWNFQSAPIALHGNDGDKCWRIRIQFTPSAKSLNLILYWIFIFALL